MSHKAPLELHREVIVPEYIDYNNHMNLAYYVLVFDHATDAFLDYLGLTEEFRADNHSSTFAAEIHVSYVEEVMEGDEVTVTTQVLDYDEKRIHFFHEMHHAEKGYLAATNELMSLYMDMAERKVGKMPQQILDVLAEVMAAHKDLETPSQKGSVLGIRRK